MRPSRNIEARDIPAHLETSFWTLVKIDWGSGCWLWQGMTQNGYGRFKVGKQRYAANRLSYALAFGYCPDDLVVRHTCDVSLCVAPHHLILGTDAQNIADRDARRRTARGERGGRALLTDSQVLEIRNDLRPAAELAAVFGVHKSTVSKIRNGINWRHLLTSDDK